MSTTERPPDAAVAQPQQPQPRRKWRRRGVIAGIAAGVALAAIVAFATLLFAPITGETEVREVEIDPFWVDAVASPQGDAANICQANVTPEGTLDLHVEAAPNTGCAVAATVDATGTSNQTWLIDGVRFTAATNDKVNTGCGAELVSGTPVDVSMTFIVRGDASPGTHLAADVTNPGLVVASPDQASGGTCPAQ